MKLLPSLVFASAVSGRLVEHQKRAAIDDCLRDSGVPTSSASTMTSFNTRLSYRPAAVAVPKTLGNVQAAVVCAKQNKVKISPMSGGHSYASLGLGGEDGHLVINLEQMNSVKLDSGSGEARIQPGARVGHVATELWNQGKKAISHGTCPG
jgi:FAD/FMN-containing dehydrogenase